MKINISFIALLFLASVSAFSPLKPSSSFRSVPTKLGSTPEPIINCHVHLFTMDHVPPEWPYKWARAFVKKKWGKCLFLKTAKLLRMLHLGNDKIDRLAALLEHATGHETQKQNFDTLQEYYQDQDAMKYVVLPMDLRALDIDPPPGEEIQKQHQELAELVNDHSDEIIPFIHIDPRSESWEGPKALDYIEKLHQDGLPVKGGKNITFAGIKLYPAFGYNFTEEELVGPILRYADTHKLPVIVHCGGVSWQATKQTETHETKEDLRRYSAPHSYLKALGDYPNMRLCLAHFGGDDEWKKFLDPKFKDMDWVSQILAMMKVFDNLYVDTSYTCCYKQYLEKLKEMLDDDNVLKERVLFGSDYYMTEQESIKDGDIIKAFQEAGIDGDLFKQIAVTNPKAFLGLK